MQSKISYFSDRRSWLIRGKSEENLTQTRGVLEILGPMDQAVRRMQFQ